MLEGILGKKVGMTRWFDAHGNSVGVTLIKSGPCYITDKNALGLQIGYEEVKKNRINKPQAGYFKKKNIPPLRHLKEIKWYGKAESQPEIGKKVFVDIFKIGEIIDIQSNSKGKGFTGVMKRWGFSGGPSGHGSRSHRVPGSIGASSDPSRVWPGQKMPGRKGNVKVTTHNLEIVDIDISENIIVVKGSVPGPRKGLVFIRRNIKK